MTKNYKFLSIILLFASTLQITANAEEKSDTLNSSVVTGTRYTMLRDQVSSAVSTVSREAINTSDAGNILSAVLEQVPGLFVTSRGISGYGVSGGAAGAISLRGFGAAEGRVVILIDGHPQFESIYGHPVPDELLSENAERVEVSRGSSSILYGSGAMGGAVNILTRKPKDDGNSLFFKVMGGSYGSARASLYDAFRKGRFSASAALSYDRTDGHRERSGFNSAGGLLTMGYRLSDTWDIASRVSYVNAYSENPGSVADPMYDACARIRRGMAGISLNNNCDRLSGTVDMYFNCGQHVINDGHTSAAPAQPFLFYGTDFTAGISAYESISLFRGNRLTAGADMMLYGGNAYRNPETEIYADHRRLNEEAIYLYDNQSFGRVNLSAGIRLDRHSQCGARLIPHLGVAWRPFGGYYTKASISRGFRVPNMRELFMYAVANEELKPEDAWSYDLTVGKHFMDGRLDMEASAFHMRGSNIIAVNIVDGKRQNRNVGSFGNSGIELSADWRILKTLKINANYSYLHMSRAYTGSPEHKAWLGAEWTSGRLSMMLGAMGISGLYLSTGDDAQKTGYLDLKARVSYRISDKLSLFVHGYNLLDRKYETMPGFPEPGINAVAGISFSSRRHQRRP